MKKQKSVSLVLLLMLMLITANVTYADEIDNGIEWISNIEMTIDGVKVEELTNVSKSSNVRILYEFDLSNQDDAIDGGDWLRLDFPDVFDFGGEAVSVDATLNGTDTVVLTASIIQVEGNNKLEVSFSEYVDLESNISGSFWFDLTFDDEKTGDEDPKNIEFGQTGDIVVTKVVNFAQAALDMTKTASYDSDTETISWLVNMELENSGTLEDITFSDTITENHELVAGSVQLNGVDVAYNYNQTSKLLEVDFAADEVATDQQITFDTVLSDDLISLSAEDITIENTAIITGKINGVDGDTDQADASIIIPVMNLEKTGVLQSDTGRIAWSIAFDSYDKTVEGLIVTDDLISKGLELVGEGRRWGTDRETERKEGV